MAKFTKWNNPNHKHHKRRLDRSEADIFAAKNMLDDKKAGIDMPLSYYDRQSDDLSGLPSRSIYDN